MRGLFTHISGFIQLNRKRCNHNNLWNSFEKGKLFEKKFKANEKCLLTTPSSLSINWMIALFSKHFIRLDQSCWGRFEFRFIIYKSYSQLNVFFGNLTSSVKISNIIKTVIFPFLFSYHVYCVTLSRGRRYQNAF